VSRADLLELRAQLLLRATAVFRPDLLLVDFEPRGRIGELLPTLRWLREEQPTCRIVLGLRDIIDEPSVVRARWAEDGVPGILERFYDLLLVYGSRDVFDVAAANGLKHELARRVRYCGYLGFDRGWRPREDARRELGLAEGRLVVANAGGGADGFRLLSRFLDALPLLQTRARSLVITGPLMPRAERDAIAIRGRVIPECRVVGYVPDLPSMLASADAVVSMFGYNVATELAALGVPAIVVPRSSPRREQLIRARVFAERGLIDMLPEDELEPGALARCIDRQLAGPPAPATPARPLDLGGLGRVVDELAGLLVSGEPK
jgi:predicted glycosyltransferase